MIKNTLTARAAHFSAALFIGVLFLTLSGTARSADTPSQVESSAILRSHFSPPPHI